MGMNCSFWASAGAASAAKAAAASNTVVSPRVLSRSLRMVASCFIPNLMRKRPQPQLFLCDLPEPREAVGLHGQKENDQGAENDQLEVGREASAHAGREQGVGRDVQENRQEDDEGGAKEGPEHGPDAA